MSPILLFVKIYKISHNYVTYLIVHQIIFIDNYLYQNKR